MVPSLTLTRDQQAVDVDEFRSEADASLTLKDDVAPNSFRSRRALLIYSHTQLLALARRQNASTVESYRVVLHLLGTLITDNTPTPQIGDNGEGGVAVEWLVDGNSLRLDYEDETEILLVARDSTGETIFCETLTAWWLPNDATVIEARNFLKRLAPILARPIPL